MGDAHFGHVHFGTIFDWGFFAFRPLVMRMAWALVPSHDRRCRASMRQSRTSSGSFTRSQAAIASSTHSISSQSCAISESSIASAAASRTRYAGNFPVLRNVEVRCEFQHLVIVHRLVGIARCRVSADLAVGRDAVPGGLPASDAVRRVSRRCKLEARLEIGMILHPPRLPARAARPLRPPWHERREAIDSKNYSSSPSSFSSDWNQGSARDDQGIGTTQSPTPWAPTAPDALIPGARDSSGRAQSCLCCRP